MLGVIGDFHGPSIYIAYSIGRTTSGAALAPLLYTPNDLNRGVGKTNTHTHIAPSCTLADLDEITTHAAARFHHRSDCL